MKILHNEDIPLSLWRELLADNPYATPFQTPEWHNLFNSVDGLSSDAVAIYENERLLALVVVTIQKESGLKSYFSRRGVIYGNPLVAKDSFEALEYLLEQVKIIGKRNAIYLELRVYGEADLLFPYFNKQNFKAVPYLNITVFLKGLTLTDVINRMNYNRKREIRKTLDLGSVYNECNSEKELIDLYKILSDLYLNRVKLPLPSLSFFKSLWLSGIGKVFIVLHNGSVIGGSFCVVLPTRSIFTMYYCGLRDYGKGIFPTHLAVLAAMDFGIQNGLEYLDFMGAGRKDVEYGVRKYKSEFGGVLIECNRYLYINNKPLYFMGNVGLKLLKLLN
jgi:serine/alanine adding enzyme